MQILRASAGSGKTYALAYEYIKNVILSPEKYSSILAVTFTNKATDEMKRRILKELDELRTPLTPQRHSYLDNLIEDLGLSETEIALSATKALGNILHDYSRFSVLTIDRFFQKILRAFVKELGVETDYAVDFNIDFIIDLSIDKLVDSSKNNKELEQSIKDYSDELIDNSKSYNLKTSLASFAKNVFSDNFNVDNQVEAKQRYIEFYTLVSESEKIIKEEIIALAKRGVEIISNAGLSVNDFPSKSKGLGVYLLKVSNSELKGYNSYVEKSLLGNDWKDGESVKGELLPILQSVCEKWDENKTLFNSVAVFAKNYRKFLLLNDISSQIDDICITSNIMLLSTTMRLLTSLIDENDAPFIYEKCGNSYSVFMIDEFQDTSVRQWKNFAPLINNALAQCEEASKCVTIVGDVKQSIYRWRGGDWKLLQGDLVSDIALTSRIKEVTLDTNWRSTRNVVAFNNAVVGSVSNVLNNELNEILNNSKDGGYITLSQRNNLYDMLKIAYQNAEQKFAPKNKEYKGYISISKCDFKEQENLLKMVSTIKDVQNRGVQAKDIAIITRTNINAKNVVEFLLEQKDVPGNENYCFDAISNQALYLTNSKAVRLIITALKLGVLNFDDTSLVLAEYNRYQNRDLTLELPADEAEVINQVRELSVVEAFEKIMAKLSPARTSNDIAYVQALYEQMINFSMQNVCDTSMFLEWWDREKKSLSITLPDGQNAINVITIHSIKGLEYDVVIIPYFDWNLSPKPSQQIWAEENLAPFNLINDTLIPYSNMLEESHFSYTYCKEKVMTYVDNVNMLYVAITRAAKELYLSIPSKPTKSSVANTLQSVLNVQADKVHITGNGSATDRLDVSISGIINENEYNFGCKDNFKSSHNNIKEENINVTELKAVDYHLDDRVQLRYSTERYYEDESGEKHLTPRSYGILMHKLFERIEHASDIEEKLNDMFIEGLITSGESVKILNIVSEAFKNGDIVQFFDTNWSVKNEQNILMPILNEKVVHLRPDRVIVFEDSAKILDYKFGELKNDKNLSQMRMYVDLMKRMGYKNVEGYIWYVQLAEIDKVTLNNELF